MVGVQGLAVFEELQPALFFPFDRAGGEFAQFEQAAAAMIQQGAAALVTQAVAVGVGVVVAQEVAVVLRPQQGIEDAIALGVYGVAHGKSLAQPAGHPGTPARRARGM